MKRKERCTQHAGGGFATDLPGGRQVRSGWSEAVSICVTMGRKSGAEHFLQPFVNDQLPL